MTPTPPNPTLYEIDTRAWLADLGRNAGCTLTLDQVPDSELDRLKELGFDWVWMLGVWRIGGSAREICDGDTRTRPARPRTPARFPPGRPGRIGLRHPGLSGRAGASAGTTPSRGSGIGSTIAGSG